MKIQIIDERLSLLSKEDGNAGYDLQAVAVFNEVTGKRFTLDQGIAGCGSVDIHAGECIKFGTGIKVHINNNNLVGLIYPRSKLGVSSGIVLGNLVGVIDANYQGELIVALWNRSEELYTVKCFDKIAQIIFTKIANPSFEVVTEFTESSERGEKGINCKELRL